MTVATYTIKDMIQRRSFIISMIIIFILIIIGFNVPNIINTVKGENNDKWSDKILIIDEDNIFEGSLKNLNEMNLGYEFEVSNNDISIDTIKERIGKEEINSGIVIKKQDNTIAVEYIVESVGTFNSAPTELIDTFAKIYTNLQINKLQLSQEQIASLNPVFDMQITQTDENAASGNVFAVMLLSLVLFYAIYFCAYQVSSSITTEKTSKIMETLVTSTTPRTIVLGKTLGIGIVGLVQVLAIIIVSVVSAKMFLTEDIISNVLDLSNITPYLAIITIIYFLLGYFLFAMLYALTGSTVSKPEDINSANSPIAILAVIGFYLSYFSMMNPSSKINVVSSIIPISAPFSMPFRIMLGTATTSQVVLSIGILIISICIVAKISIKIYSSAILNYGTKLNIKEMFKIYKDKNN